MTIRISIDNLTWRTLMRRLEDIGGANILDDLKPIVQSAAKEMKSFAKQELRRQRVKRSGFLNKQIKIGKFSFKRSKGKLHAAFGIGKGSMEFEGETITAWRYAHFIENGFSHRTSGPIPAKPFMRPAWDRVSRPTYDRMIVAIKRRLGL